MAPGALRPASDPCSRFSAKEKYSGLLRGDDLTLADDGLYKLWRDGAGGWYTVGIEYFQTQKDMENLKFRVTFTCRANDSWDDLSDEC